MKMYIKGTSAISPQNTFDKKSYLDPWVDQSGAFLNAIAPAYREYINPRLLRRMSPIIKMGVTTAKDALQQAKVEEPDAIIVGTGLGCIDDTENFLKDIIESEEGVLSPTAFIQSTHNTIAGQIALLLECNNYNFTYSNRGHSFENAVIDASILLEEGKENILVGCAEEATPTTYEALKQLGCVGENKHSQGAVLGEGASFFVLSNQGDETTPYVKGIKTSNYLQPEDLTSSVVNFLQQHQLKADDIDVILHGACNERDTNFYDKLDSILPDAIKFRFKEISGEHFTASGFAMHLGCMMLLEQRLFNIHGQIDIQKPMKNILIYNHYKRVNHSFILLAM